MKCRIQTIFLNSIVILSTLLIQGFMVAGVVPARALVQPGQTPDGLTSVEWAAVQESAAAAEYHFAYHNADDAHAAPYYWAPNRAQGWQTVFTPQGMQVTAPGSDWMWGLRLAGYGHPGGFRSLDGSVPVLTASQATLTCRWDANLSEWWVNSPQGLEQGFTLQALPSGQAAGQRLLVDLAVRGSLTPALRGNAIAFLDADGAVVLTYDTLHVTDADGRVLPARLELPAPSQAVVRLSIDDTAARYPLTIDPWVQTAKLTASDGVASDYFGESVAVSGDTVVVGAAGDDSNRGSAYVYVKGTGWGFAAQIAKLTASDGAANDRFGGQVAISGDTVVVGAVGDDGLRGSAYVYVKPVSGWVDAAQTAKLTASDRAVDDYFGGGVRGVAISGDTVVVGANGDDAGVAYNQGSAYVYVKPAGGWANTTETAKLTASDGAASDYFGISVAISGDTVVVGAYMDDGLVSGSGSAYVYVKPGGGWITTSAQTAKLTASDGAANDYFGVSVAISGDTVVVGAYYDNESYTDQGSACVYVKPVGGWMTTSAYTAKLTASDGAANDRFGRSVAVSGDTVAVGTSNDDSDRGSVYVYVKPVGGWGNAAQAAKLTASDGAANDNFGKSIAVSGDTVVAGAHYDDSLRGSAYVFNLGYAVTYDANGATSGAAPASQTKTSGVNLTLATNTGSLVKTGYALSGWNTNSTGTGTHYALGGTYSTEEDVTLYAEWTLNTYVVTYDANGATSGAAPANQTKTSGVNLTLATNTGSLVKTGYTLSGWNTAANGSGTHYATGETYTANAPLALYAEWTLNTYTLIYTAGANGTISGTSPQTMAHGASGTTVTAVPAANYHFVSWSDGVITASRTDTNVTENKSVTANFAIDTYTLTYTAGANGTISGTSPQTVAHGASGTAVTAVPAANYHFVSWSDGVTTASRTDTNVTENKSVTANFAIDTYTVTYDANSATGGTAPSAQSKTHGVDLTLATNTGSLVKDGYIFNGWNTAANGSGTHYDAGASYTANDPLTLYAEWKENAPVVQSITLAGLNPIDGAGVDFTVTFSKPVSGVDKADFSLTRTGSIMSASVTKVVAVSQSVYTVTVTSGSGNGSLRLDLPATATIQDLFGNAFVGPYIDGETYTVKGPAPTVPVLKLPKNKSLLTTSTPTLDWDDSSQVMALETTGWHYEIQVTAPYGAYNETFNTQASTDAAAGLGASSFTIPADKSLPADTAFTWRVRAFDAAYRYSAWSKQFTFRTGTPVIPPTEGAPTVPVLKSPKNKSLVAGYSLVLLDWNDSALPATAPAGCLYYEVRVTSPYRNYNAAFTTAASEYTIPAENILPADSTFTWQVRSACNDGTTTKYSVWSKEFTFRTKLATPTLLSPLDDPATPLDNIRPTFTWEPVPGAATYTLQVLKDGKVVVTGTVKAPAYSFAPRKDLLANQLYTWKVKANGRNPGDYSAPFTFLTGASAPAIPTPSAPKNNALTETAVEQTLMWSLVDNTTPAVSYEVEYATNAAFLESTVLPAADKQLVLSGGTFLPGRTYYWRVRSWSGADATGLHSPWSKALAIKVKFVAPTLTTPAAGTTVGVTPTFTWDSANGLWKNYTLQIAMDADFKVGLKNFTVKAPLTTFTLPKKSPVIPGAYFWRVKINGVYTPITSEAQSFTVAP